MNLQLELDVRRELARYLAGEQTLSAFRKWLDAESWDAGPGVAADIDLLFAEYTAGDWTEEEVRSKLRNMAETVFVTQQGWGTAGVVVSTGTSTAAVQVPSESVVDIRLEVVSE